MPRSVIPQEGDCTCARPRGRRQYGSGRRPPWSRGPSPSKASRSDLRKRIIVNDRIAASGRADRAGGTRRGNPRSWPVQRTRSTVVLSAPLRSQVRAVPFIGHRPSPARVRAQLPLVVKTAPGICAACPHPPMRRDDLNLTNFANRRLCESAPFPARHGSAMSAGHHREWHRRPLEDQIDERLPDSLRRP